MHVFSHRIAGDGMRCDYEDITLCHTYYHTICVVFCAAAQLPPLFSLALNLCDCYITFRPPPRKRRPARRGRLVPERSRSDDERTRTSNSLFSRGAILRVGMTRNAITCIYFAFNLKKKQLNSNCNRTCADRFETNYSLSSSGNSY